MRTTVLQHSTSLWHDIDPKLDIQKTHTSSENDRKCNYTDSLNIIMFCESVHSAVFEVTFSQGHLPVEFKGGRMAAGTGASDAHHRAPKQCKRDPAPYVGHDLSVVALVEVADLSCEALQEAVT